MKTSRKPISLTKKSVYISFAVVAFILICAGLIILFPGLIINNYLESRIKSEFLKDYPGSTLNIFSLNCDLIHNSIISDSICFRSKDRMLTCRISSLSLRDINWLNLVFTNSLTSGALERAVIKVEKIKFNSLKSGYEYGGADFVLSVFDSAISVRDVKLNPKLPDNEFFDESKFAKKSYRLDIHELKFNGVDCRSLVNGKSYSAHSIIINSSRLEIAAVKYKPSEISTQKGTMPNELFSGIKSPVKIDSIIVSDGFIKYSELFSKQNKTSFVTFDGIGLNASGLSNQSPENDILSIDAHAKLWNAGLVTLSMAIPLTSSKFNMHYSGNLSPMHLDKVNSFLIPAENKKISSGYVHSIKYDVHVIDGKANGFVRGEYENLKLAFLDKRTKKGSGLGNIIKSFIANTFRIRGTNMPDKSGKLKIGISNYTRQKDDTFFELTWVTLRIGIMDTIGL